jgi:iron complex transport system substrate-binding protein
MHWHPLAAAVTAVTALAAVAPSKTSIPPPSPTIAPSTAAPRRIVSLNLCTDQLVVQLADRSRIAGVTWLALDRTGSVVADQAIGLPITYGSAEEITRLRPDLVIAGRHTTRTAIALIKRFGYRVVEVDAPVSFDQIESQIQQIADLVGAPERGARMIEDMRTRLARAKAAAPAAATSPVAAVFNTNGGTQGTGTLTDAVIRASGLRNMAAEAGVRGYGQLSLEQLLLSRPDIIVLPDLRGVTLSVAQQFVAHPAFARRAAASRVVYLPGKWTSCGGPWTVNAVEHLQRALR